MGDYTSNLMSDRVEGIILAAGMSSRMGRPKLLIEIDGEPIILKVTAAAAESGLDRVTLVIGPGREDLITVLKRSRVTRDPSIIINPRPEQGMSSSMRLGISSINPLARGSMILLGDQPRITPGIIDSLLRIFLQQKDKIVVPTVRSRRTTPVIFPASLFPELMRVTGDQGGRELLKHHSDQVVEIEMGDDYDDSDVDSPEDLERIKNKHRRE